MNDDIIKPITDYVCTLEQADKLWQLGVSEIAKESLFVWVKGLVPQTEPMRSGWTVANRTDMRGAFYEGGSFLLGAFTSQELGEMIDEICSDWNQGKTNVSRDYKIIYSINGYLMSKIEGTCDLEGNLSKVKHEVSSVGSESIILNNYKSEAQVRAAFLIYLLENRI
jgi:hypothetical protein